ncbi:uncharacterized protein LOC103488315 isoform X3 [Cucumis melo]|uniref:Uncharacterized protein LOC103488315 isoform X3 n=1 Tax=Cucumis melo TaxID=3656 RepID=A0A1S3BCX1_CUCME|nr:uncharacterized protein LOC103488315 isoform X3 [Cucumis melo]
MPRPGPRPYECVRRAWHSDRHQPIRGSLIQQIFRVVHEIHNSSTKKNKEWQEVLPVVVLKAEEILYSKASSEAEYMDFGTLRYRLLDAINTIIRLDESTETGDFLQPCIEGCTPRKASRSQRNNVSTYYLSPRNQESPMLMKTSQGAVNSSRCVPYCWSLAKSVDNGMSNSGFRFQSFLPAHNSTSGKFPAFSSSHGLIGNDLPPSRFSVYPLYYGNGVQWQGQHSGFKIAPSPVSINVDSTNGGVMGKTKAYCTMAANGITQNEVMYSFTSPCDDECDLALRLGPFSASISRCENKASLGVLKVGSGSSLKETRTEDCFQVMERKFPLFSMRNAYGISEHDTWGQSLEGECVDPDTRMRKRKADFSDSLKERHFSLLPKLSSSRFIG